MVIFTGPLRSSSSVSTRTHRQNLNLIVPDVLDVRSRQVIMFGVDNPSLDLQTELGTIRQNDAPENGTANADSNDPELDASNVRPIIFHTAFVAGVSDGGDGVARVSVTEDMQIHRENTATTSGNAASPNVEALTDIGAQESNNARQRVIEPGEQNIHTANLSPGHHVPNDSGTSAGQQHLPDILNSHVPPAYESLSCSRSSRRQRRVISSLRMPRGRFVARNSNQQQTVLRDDLSTYTNCKCTNCSNCFTTITHFKWVLVLLSIVGLTCCALGIILGAMHMSGTSNLTLSLMFIGLGVMLIIVVVIAWKCTPNGHEPCHLLFGLGAYSDERQLPSLPDNTARHGGQIPRWHGGMIYAECANRQPPPSYAASMQQYGQPLPSRLTSSGLPSSPPPTYRSQAGTMRPGLHITFPLLSSDYPNSRPPTYRSHISNSGTLRRPSILEQTNEAVFGGHGPIALAVNGETENISVIQVSTTCSEVATCSVDSCGSQAQGTSVHNDICHDDQRVTANTACYNDASSANHETGDVTITISRDDDDFSEQTCNDQCLGTAERRAVECLDNILADSICDVTPDTSFTNSMTQDEAVSPTDVFMHFPNVEMSEPIML